MGPLRPSHSGELVKRDRMLRAGDNITVKFLPARDTSPLGFLKTVIMPDGRVIQISAGNPND